MSWWNPFSPRGGVAKRPRKPPVAKKAYKLQPRGIPIVASESPPDADVYRALESKRAQSRNEIENDSLASGFLALMQRNVIGNGMAVRCESDKLKGAWQAWGMDCQRNGDGWWELEYRALQSLVVDGEAIVLSMPHAEKGLEVRLVDAACLDRDCNMKRRNGAVVSMGIEYEDEAPVAYWFRDLDFSVSQTQGGYRRGKRTRIDARNVHFCAWTVQATQRRGMPMLAPVLTRSQQLRRYEENEALASAIANKHLAVYTTEAGEFAGDGDEHDYAVNQQSEPDAPEGDGEETLADKRRRLRKELLGNDFLGEDDGGFEVEDLAPGQDLKTLSFDHPKTAYRQFVETHVRAIAAGLGVAYHSISGNLSGVNFSSGRMGEMEARRTYAFVRKLLIRRIFMPIFRAWQAQAFLAKELSQSEAGMIVEFVGERWQHIQPKEQAASDHQRLQDNLISHSEIIRERGSDPDEVFAEIKADAAKLKGLGDGDTGSADD